MALADGLFNSLQGGLLDLLQNVEKQYKIKLQQQEEQIKQLRQQNEELQQKVDEIDIYHDEDESKYQGSEDGDDHQMHLPRIDVREDDDEDADDKKPANFWQEVTKALEDSNLEFIKGLIRQNKIKMDDIDNDDRNLLMLAAQYGSYELVSMCINLGANIDAEDGKKMTALKIARKKGRYNVYNYKYQMFYNYCLISILSVIFRFS